MSIAEQITQLKTDFDEVYEAGYEKGKSEILKTLTIALQKTPDYSYMFENSSIDNATLSSVMDDFGKGSKIEKAIAMFKNTKNISDALYTDNLDFSNCVTLREAFN